MHLFKSRTPNLVFVKDSSKILVYVQFLFLDPLSDCWTNDLDDIFKDIKCSLDHRDASELRLDGVQVFETNGDQLKVLFALWWNEIKKILWLFLS